MPRILVGIGVLALGMAILIRDPEPSRKSGAPAEQQSFASKSSTPKPPTPKQRLAGVRQSYGAWTGSEEQFAEGMGVLADLKEEREVAQAAKSLERQWRSRMIARRARLAAEKVKEEKSNMSVYEGTEAQLAVGGVELRRSMNYSRANKGFTYVLVFVSVRNTGAEGFHVNPLSFTLTDSGGHTVPCDSETFGLDSSALNAVDIQPGRSTSGWLAFLAAQDARYTLRFAPMLQEAVEKVIIP